MDIGQAANLPLTLKNLIAGGAKLEQILPAFTSNVANILRLHDRGRITVGNAADVVVLDDNDAISDVMIAGIWHVKDGKQRIFGQFEEHNGATPE